MINLGMLNNPEYSLKDEAGSVSALGMEYVHIPVVFENPTRQNLLDFFKAMEEAGEKDLRALRHEHARFNLYRSF